MVRLIRRPNSQIIMIRDAALSVMSDDSWHLDRPLTNDLVFHNVAVEPGPSVVEVVVVLP